MGVFADVPLIADTSALAIWRRVPPGDAKKFAEAAQAGEILTSPIVKLEFLHDAFDVTAFDTRQQMFSAFDVVELAGEDGAAAVKAMDDLAHRAPIQQGYHKVKAGDALIAVSAVRAGVGVLHYDRDFQRLAQVLPDLVEVAFVPFGTV